MAPNDQTEATQPTLTTEQMIQQMQAVIEKLHQRQLDMEKDHEEELREARGEIADLRKISMRKFEAMDTDSSTSAVITERKTSKIKIDKPKAFDGNKGNLQGFLTMAQYYLQHYQAEFNDEASKVLFIAGRLEGNALTWFEPIMRDFLTHMEIERDARTTRIFSSYANFETELRDTFGNPDERRQAERDLQNCKQKTSVSAYFAEFQQIVSRLGWTDDSLRERFYTNLKDSVKDEIAVRDQPADFAAYAKLCILIDDRIYERQKEKRGGRTSTRTYTPNTGKRYQRNNNKKGSTAYGQNAGPMELDATQRDTSKVKCYNCDKLGHYARDCRSKKKNNWKPVPEGNRRNGNAGYRTLSMGRRGLLYNTVIRDSDSDCSSTNPFANTALDESDEEFLQEAAQEAQRRQTQDGQDSTTLQGEEGPTATQSHEAALAQHKEEVSPGPHKNDIESLGQTHALRPSIEESTDDENLEQQSQQIQEGVDTIIRTNQPLLQRAEEVLRQRSTMTTEPEEQDELTSEGAVERAEDLNKWIDDNTTREVTQLPLYPAQMVDTRDGGTTMFRISGVWWAKAEKEPSRYDWHHPGLLDPTNGQHDDLVPGLSCIDDGCKYHFHQKKNNNFFPRWKEGWNDQILTTIDLGPQWEIIRQSAEDATLKWNQERYPRKCTEGGNNLRDCPSKDCQLHQALKAQAWQKERDLKQRQRRQHRYEQNRWRNAEKALDTRQGRNVIREELARFWAIVSTEQGTPTHVAGQTGDRRDRLRASRSVSWKATDSEGTPVRNSQVREATPSREKQDRARELAQQAAEKAKNESSC